MPTTPPTITALPAPPDPNDRSTFNTRAYPWSVAQQTLATEVGNVATNVYNNAVETASNAAAAADSVTDADSAAASAAASAASAINAPGTSATSTTSLALTAGAKAWTIQTGKLYPPGQPIYLASAANPTVNRMYGILGTHDNTTGACTATMTPDPGASGTHTDWIMGIGVSLANGPSLPRIARTSNTALTVAEKGKLIDITSGTFAQTTDSGGTLGADWYAYLTNTGTGAPTFGTLALAQGAMVLLHSDGTTVRAYPQRVPEQILVVRDEKTQGTAGDAVGSVSTWVARTLNTTAANTIPGASLASNLVSLKAGTYYVSGSDMGYRTNSHKARLYNVTASAVLLQGTAENANAPDYPAATRSLIGGQFTLAADSQIRLEHYAANSSGGTFGVAVGGTSGTEVYAELTFRKVSP